MTYFCGLCFAPIKDKEKTIALRVGSIYICDCCHHCATAMRNLTRYLPDPSKLSKLNLTPYTEGIEIHGGIPNKNEEDVQANEV